MHTVLKKLYRDHAHFNRLITLLEEQLDQLKTEGSADLTLLTEIVTYLGDYSDATHHPIEDQLYQMMLARSDDGREAMEKLLSEHLITIDITRLLRLALDAMKQNSAGSREQVEKVGRECVEHQRQHMVFEEKEAFPFLRHSLDDAAFDLAAAALPPEEDPLMDSNMRSRYPALFAHMSS